MSPERRAEIEARVATLPRCIAGPDCRRCAESSRVMLRELLAEIDRQAPVVRAAEAALEIVSDLNVPAWSRCASVTDTLAAAVDPSSRPPADPETTT